MTKTEASTATDMQSTAKPPGPIVFASTVVSVAVLVCVRYGWQPARFGNMTRPDALLYGVAGGVVLMVTGLIWAIRTLNLVGRDRQWSWWVPLAPGVVIAAAVVAVLMPPKALDEARPQFQQLGLAISRSST